jgi:glycosyltransferase involved in cell wall biosynthesis
MDLKKDHISIIIPHRGRIDLLQKTIASIGQQTYAHNLLDIIVVTQDTAFDTSLITPDPTIAITILPADMSFTISKLRNLGAEKSTSEFLTFIDADIFLSSNWCTEMVKIIKTFDSVVCLSAVQIVSDKPTQVEIIRTRLASCRKSGYVESLPGANLFMRKAIFSNTVGFPEHLITCEDIFFTNSLTNYGKLLIIDSANFVHLGEDKTFRQVFTKEIWRAKSNLQSTKNRKLPLRELPSIVLPIWTPVSGSGFLISLLLGQFFIAFIFLILTLIPIALYSARAYLCYNKLKPRYSIFSITFFYFLYQIARAIGTVKGLLFQTR